MGVSRADTADQRAYEAACLGLARRITGDTALAEDVVQDVYLRLWRHPEGFEPARGSLRTFLLTNVHHRAVDTVRAEHARRRREARYSRETERFQPGCDGDVATRLDREWLEQALRTLNDAEQTAIALAYFNGMSYREVAAFLEEPEGTVKSRIRVALQRLRAQLD